MARIYPNTATAATSESTTSSSGEPVVLTVWRKSLLFNGDGFTVFDSSGNLTFRVENYASVDKGEVVLMEAAGKPLLTVRRKRITFGDQWLVYSGEASSDPLLSSKKKANLVGNLKLLANVTTIADGRMTYSIEGSYLDRSCVVYNALRRNVAEIKKKEVTAGGVVLGDDVFKLVVEPSGTRPLQWRLFFCWIRCTDPGGVGQPLMVNPTDKTFSPGSLGSVL